MLVRAASLDWVLCVLLEHMSSVMILCVLLRVPLCRPCCFTLPCCFDSHRDGSESLHGRPSSMHKTKMRLNLFFEEASGQSMKMTVLLQAKPPCCLARHATTLTRHDAARNTSELYSSPPLQQTAKQHAQNPPWASIPPEPARWPWTNGYEIDLMSWRGHIPISTCTHFHSSQDM